MLPVTNRDAIHKNEKTIPFNDTFVSLFDICILNQIELT